MRLLEYNSRLVIQIASIPEYNAQTAVANCCTTTTNNGQLTRTRRMCALSCFYSNLTTSILNGNLSDKIKRTKIDTIIPCQKLMVPQHDDAQSRSLSSFSVAGLDHARNNKTTRLFNIPLLHRSSSHSP